MSGRGVIYLVAGSRSYVGELLTSLESLRRHEPELPVTVFSPFRLPRSAQCDHVDYRSEHHPLKQKVLVLSESPYDQTLFLDTDTTVLGPIRPVFAHLANFDLGVANSFLADRSRPDRPQLLDLVNPDEYNTGVLLFDLTVEGVQKFLARWRGAVLPQDPTMMWPGHLCDQTHFNRIVAEGAFEEAGVRFGPLPNTVWNVRGPMIAELKRTGRWEAARILHYRTRSMKLRQLLFSATDVQSYRRVLHKAGRLVDRSPQSHRANESEGRR